MPRVDCDGSGRMTIRLRIDNVDRLPDGGPLHYEARLRGFEFGRDPHLDWSLPDPSRYISGRHCEIRYDNGGYWLYDVSRNGTFLNGASARVKSPHRLASGDRLQVGQYLISVEIDDVAAADEGAVFDTGGPPGAGSDNIWDTGTPAPAPMDRRQFAPPAQGRRAPDFSEQFLDLPQMRPAPSLPHVSESPFGTSTLPAPTRHMPAPRAPSRRPSSPAERHARPAALPAACPRADLP